MNCVANESCVFCAAVVAGEALIGDVHVGETAELFCSGSATAPRLGDPHSMPFDEFDDVLRVDGEACAECAGVSASKG